jgi:hypothetical protein
MNKNLLLISALCGATFLSGCVYDESYGSRRVTVSTGSPYSYYGDYDEYSPYYSYSGRRYYRTGSRYVYYSNRRPYYVSSLPSRSIYITPSRRVVSTRVVTPVRYNRYERSDSYDRNDPLYRSERSYPYNRYDRGDRRYRRWD